MIFSIMEGIHSRRRYLGTKREPRKCGKRDKRDVCCNKQVEEVVTVFNCVLKGSWGEGESGGISVIFQKSDNYVIYFS